MIVLIDTSAWIWAEQHPEAPAAQQFAEHMEAGCVATCRPMRLEVLRGAPSTTAYDHLATNFAGTPEVPIDQAVQERAQVIQRLLAAESGSRHRSIPIVDLLIAAAAIEAGMAIVHRDRDYQTIAAVTDQPQRWLGPR